MTKLRTILFGSIFALVCSITTTSLLAAGASNFAGPFIAVQASVNGVELDGSTTDSNSQVQNGAGGMFGIAGGFELGYNIPLGDTLFITVGGMLNPGDAKIKVDAGGSANSDNTDVTIELTDLVTLYIQPSIAISENSAVFIKLGSTSADLTITGDVTKLTGVDGETFAIGTTTLTDTGAFFKTEAGLTTFDNIKVTGLGTYIATTNTAQADPTSAYGAFTIGYKF